MNRYFDLSRSRTYSLLFAVPLLLLYETGAAWLAGGEGAALRNGADVLLRTLFAAAGVRGTLAFTAVLIAAAAAFVVLEQRRRRVPVRARVFVGMFAESTLYALLFGAVVGTATRVALGGLPVRLAAQEPVIATLPLREGLVLSLGAGIYEEIVFRLLLVGGLALLLGALGLSRTWSGVMAILLAAIIFSAFHYIGPYGDAWALQSFVFRFLAGAAFSALFLLRGFGITAWTHALYDVFLLLARNV